MRVNTGSDDAEERIYGVDLASSDLELVEDGGSGAQTVGVRFTTSISLRKALTSPALTCSLWLMKTATPTPQPDRLWTGGG